MATTRKRKASPKRKPGRPSIRDDRREVVLELALRLIAEKGIDGFQMVDITRALALSPAAIYRHFRDRDEIVVEVQKLALAEVLSVLEGDRRAIEERLPPRCSARVAALVPVLVSANRYLSLAESMPAHHALISHSVGAPAALVATAAAVDVMPAISALLDVIATQLANASAHHALANGNPAERARDLWCALLGVSQTAKLDRLAPHWEPAKQRGLRVMCALLRGWGANPQSVIAATTLASRLKLGPPTAPNPE